MPTFQKQRVILIFLIILVGVVSIGTFSYFIFRNNANIREEDSPVEESHVEEKQEENKTELKFLKKIEIGDGYFPGIIFDGSSFYIFYERNSYIYVKEYDEGFELKGQETSLTNTSGANFQVVYDGTHFYIVDALLLRKFDTNWKEIKNISYYNLLSKDIAEQWEHGVDDMLLYQNRGDVFIGIASNGEKVNKEDDKDAKKVDIPDSLYVQKFNSDLIQTDDFLLKDIGNVPGSSILIQDGNLIVVSSNKHWNDSSLISLQYDEDLNLIERKVISEVENANEEFPMGLLFTDNMYFVGYHHVTGNLSIPMGGDYLIKTDVILKVFDKDWNMISEALVTDEGTFESEHNNAGRPHLVYVNDKIYIAYDVDHNIYVKEYELVKN